MQVGQICWIDFMLAMVLLCTPLSHAISMLISIFEASIDWSVQKVGTFTGKEINNRGVRASPQKEAIAFQDSNSTMGKE